MYLYISTNAVNRVAAACPPFEALSWLVMLSVCRLSLSLPFPTGIFFHPEHNPDLALRRSLEAICEISVNISFPAPPPLPFLSPSSPLPHHIQHRRARNLPIPRIQLLLLTAAPPPKSPASVAFALLSPPAPILELPLSTTSLLSSHRTLTLTHLPREICRPQPRASKAIWIDTL